VREACQRFCFALETLKHLLKLLRGDSLAADELDRHLTLQAVI
jgi:hypothetical protein